MSTRAAARAADFSSFAVTTVFRRAEVLAMGITDSQLRARIAAGRWQRLGRAVVLHNGPVARDERWQVALLNCGPRAVLASFTATEFAGLVGWARDEVHVLAPSGTALPSLAGIPLVLHRTSRPIVTASGGLTQSPADAVVLAASSFARPRPACGIVAAAVQQRLTSARALTAALDAAPRTRHRAVVRAAVDDIAMGAQALSEIDFVGLCRRNGLPMPTLQAIRVEPGGRRRYLDAEWRRRDGRRVAAEVDGALHLSARRWYADQLRQNEIVLGGTLVLRFPSVVVRTEERLVADQLRRALRS
jgi:hypothetical protein